MKRLLAEALPDLARDAAVALRSQGLADAAHELSSAIIQRCTYDAMAKAGYVYIFQEQPVRAGETPAAETVPFADPYWFNVNLRASGRIYGIEVQSPTQELIDIVSGRT